MIRCKIIQFRNQNDNFIKKIYFYPEFPHPYSVVYQVFHQLGIQLRKGIPNTAQDNLCFWWEDNTFTGRSPNTTFINAQCTDISKKYVNLIHKDIFKYSLEVDPTVYSGMIVEKSNTNGIHDGRIIEGPIEQLADGVVYQKVVRNYSPESPDTVCDIRLAVFNGNPSFGYLKYRPTVGRFSNKNTVVHVIDIISYLTCEEINSICEFCQRIGLDYGEIDVVRDLDDRKIYVLDINKTPLGPPNGLSEKDRRYALQLYKEEFVRWFYPTI